MGRLSGTPKGVTIDRTKYEVPADANFTINPISTVEGQATSGDTMYKETKQVMTVEGVTLSVDPVQHILLTDSHEKTKPFPLSYTLADGTVYSSKGRINIDEWSSETNIATIMLIPTAKWQVFPA